MTFIEAVYLKIIKIGEFIQSILLLAMRLFWGGSLMFAGWGKLQDMSTVIDFFHSLAIPFPILNAYFVSYIECLGGFCFLIGLASRLVSIPLMCVMFGAIFFTHPEALANAWDEPQKLIDQAPFNYLFATLIVFAFGPGKISVDGVIKQLFFRIK